MSSTRLLLRSSRETLHKRNVIILGVSFLFLFASYNTAQNLVTSILAEHFGSLGFYSLCLIYFGAALSTFVATSCVNFVGERVCLIVTSFLLVLYAASLIHVVPAVVYISSSIWGIGSGILWTAQGSFLAKNSSAANRSSYAGLFWSIFQLSAIFGNFGAFLLASVGHVADAVLMVALTACGALGFGLLFFLRRVVDENVVVVEADAVVATEQPEQSLSLLRSLAIVARNRSLYLLFALNFFIGWELSFSVGSWTTYLDEKKIGLYMTFFGIAEVLGGSFWGVAIPLLGSRRLVMVLALLIYVSSILGSFFYHWHLVHALQPVIPFFVSFGFGKILRQICCEIMLKLYTHKQ
jgi:MFS family permease